MNSTKSRKKTAARGGGTPKTVSDYFNPDPKTAAEAIRDLVLANRILPELQADAEPPLSHDASTNALLRRVRALRRGRREGS